MLAMLEMMMNGVSTRKIEQVTEELCGRSFSRAMVSDLCRRLGEKKADVGRAA